MRWFGRLVSVCLACAYVEAQTIEAGSEFQVSISKVPGAEKARVDGMYKVDGNGMLQLPLLQEKLAVRGLTYPQISVRIEKAYRDAGIYPECDVQVLEFGKGCILIVPVVTVGGSVSKPGPVKFQEGMVLQQVVAIANDGGWIKRDQEIWIERDGTLFCYNETYDGPQKFRVQVNDTIEIRKRVSPEQFLQPGQAILITIRGVPRSDKERVDGMYSINAEGMLRMPLLEKAINVKGYTEKTLAREIAETYRKAGIYPAAEIQVGPAGCALPREAMITIGGSVLTPGAYKYSQGMTLHDAVLQANAGKRLPERYGILLFRDGKGLQFDERCKERLEGFELQPGDTIEVKQNMWSIYGFPAKK